MRILVGINTLTNLEQQVYANHCQMWFRFGRHHPDIDFILNAPRRSSIDRMRNFSAKVALQNDCDYVLFIDDDILIPMEGLKKLLAMDVDVAAGWTIIRGYPFHNMFFRFDAERKGLHYLDVIPKDEVQEDGSLEVDAVGFSFALIKCSLLKRIPTPFFVTGTHNTEDVYFCMKAQEFAPDVKIAVNLKVETGHCLGAEYIQPSNRDAYIQFMKTAYPELIQEDKAIVARGDDYLKMIKAPTAENIEEVYVQKAT